jgi:hypothetical protein
MAVRERNGDTLVGIDWGDKSFVVSVEVLTDTLAGSPYVNDPRVRDILTALNARPTPAEFERLIGAFNGLPTEWRVELRDSAEMIARLRATADF